MEEGVVGATELLDAKVVVVDEALKRFYAILHCAHFDAAAHAVEGHRDHGVAGLPTDGAVFGIVGDRAHTRPGFGGDTIPSEGFNPPRVPYICSKEHHVLMLSHPG